MKSRVAVALILACSPVLAGRQSAQQPEPTSPPTFRVQVDAVELDAVVTDPQGNPVTDLTAGDFELFEDGKPQTITSFSLVNIPIERAERSLFSAHGVEPDVQSNDQGEGRLYLMALDEVDGEQALRTRRFLHRFIEQYFGPRDVAAVVFLGRADQTKAQPFTSNVRLLLESIDQFSGGFGAVDVTPSRTAAALGAVPSRPAITEADVNFRRAMSSLRQITELTAGIRGRRKAVLVFSQGFPIDIYNVLDYQGQVLKLPDQDLHAAITAATRGNVTIYPIDPRGLTVDGGIAENQSGFSSDASVRRASSFARMDARLSLRAMAEATGGFAVTNTNSFESAFARIVRENSSYYVLAFTSMNERRDGRYRKLEVRVKRPGLQVRTRAGYVAPLRAGRAAPPERALERLSPATAEALGSAVALPGVPMRVFAAPYKTAQREARIVLATEVDTSSLGLVESNGTFVGTLEVSHAAVDGRNKVHPGERFAVNLSLKPDTYERMVEGGARLVSELSLPPGRYQVRVAAGNRRGRAGSVIYDLDVPDFTKAPLSMSGISLTSVLSSRATTFGQQAPFGDALPGPITATREFRAGDRLMLFVEVYENNRTRTPHALDLKVEMIDGEGRILHSSSERRTSTELSNARGAYVLTAELPLDNLAAGAHAIRVEARSTIGEGLVATREIPIRVK